jgi:hypothetical protein
LSTANNNPSTAVVFLHDGLPIARFRRGEIPHAQHIEIMGTFTGKKIPFFFELIAVHPVGDIYAVYPARLIKVRSKRHASSYIRYYFFVEIHDEPTYKVFRNRTSLMAVYCSMFLYGSQGFIYCVYHVTIYDKINNKSSYRYFSYLRTIPTTTPDTENSSPVFDDNVTVRRIFRMEYRFTILEQEPLYDEPPVINGKHDVTASRPELSVNDQDVTIDDMGSGHGIPTTTYAPRTGLVSYEIFLQIDGSLA